MTDKLTVNSQAMRAFPIDDVVYRQAMLLALAGEDEAARRQWDRAVVSFPETARVGAAGAAPAGGGWGERAGGSCWGTLSKGIVLNK